jgi:hypothetical protein
MVGRWLMADGRWLIAKNFSLPVGVSEKKAFNRRGRGGKTAKDAEKVISPQRTLRSTEEFWLMADRCWLIADSIYRSGHHEKNWHSVWDGEYVSASAGRED